MKTFFAVRKYYLGFVLVLGLLYVPVSTVQLHAQITPGLIVKPALSPGNAVMDPDRDGYVSLKVNGVQSGFTIPPNNDVVQSEIPYVSLVKPDPRADLLRGPTGSFSEIVGVDAAGNNAILTYTDGTNVFYRFRLDYMSPNTITYSILIDTDGKFGFTGDNADPNAVSGNPGFEIEVALTTNFYVRAYKVDGTTSGTLVYSAPYETNCQKAVAVTHSSDNPDFFYDFYLPLSALTGITFAPPTYPANITASSPLRYAALTTMNTSPAIGNNAISDVGGQTGSGSLDAILTQYIESQTPTPPGEEVLDRSACPFINAITAGNTTITGTSSEPSGTLIKVYVYQSNGTTLTGSGTTYTSGSTWSINVASLSPSVTLTAGQVVKATATAPEKGVSYDNCSNQIVNAVACNTPPPVSMTAQSNGRFSVVFTLQTAGTKTIKVYNADGSVWGSATSTSTTVNTYVNVSNGTPMTSNGKVPNGTYYASVTFNGCESDKIVICYGASTTAGPTVNSPVVAGATTVSGTGIIGGNIKVFADGVLIGSVNNLSSTNWSVTVPPLSLCKVITATQSKVSTDLAGNPGNGSCESAASPGVTVTRTAYKPVILSTACVTAPFSVGGSSVEANGTTVTLYTPNSAGTVLGTATVTNGYWQVNGLTLSSGSVVVAKVTSGNCLTPSVDSDPVTISAKTSVTAYNLTINAPVEGSGFVNGAISGGTYPVVVKVYVNEIQVGNGTIVNGSGTWLVTGLSANDLYAEGVVRVTLTAASACESNLSSVNAIVQCSPPPVPSYTAGSYSYCYGGVGQVVLNTSQAGVVYQLVNSSGVAQGPSAIGTGTSLSLYTKTLTTSLTGIYVRAYKVLNTSCAITSTDAINFNVQLAAPTITFSSTSLSVAAGISSVNLLYNSKSASPSADKYTIDYSYAAEQEGFKDINTPITIPSSPIVLSVPNTPAPAPGTYTGIISVYSNSGSSCESVYGFTITVYGATSPPVIKTDPVGKTICSGTSTSLSVAAVGTGTLSYQWQTADSYVGTYTNVTTGSGGTSANYTTPVLSATRYYRVVVTNTYGSSISNTAVVNVTSTPSVPGTITGKSVVPAGSNYLLYSVPAVEGATSYTWSYSGTGVSILGSSNSVYISFDSNATSGVLSVYGSNLCGNGSPATINITIDYKDCIISNRMISKKLIR
ncbi:MAG: hypothetical protein VB102_01100 [Paludibacter sp.]|nr:hypothetical protein [Paludibacter sp.]